MGLGSRHQLPEHRLLPVGSNPAPQRARATVIGRRSVPFWRYTGAMPVSLSVKDVPEDLAKALRARAAANHRSLQGELLHILESAVRPRPFRANALWQRLQSAGAATPAEATTIIRNARDRR